MSDARQLPPSRRSTQTWCCKALQKIQIVLTNVTLRECKNSFSRTWLGTSRSGMFKEVEAHGAPHKCFSFLLPTSMDVRPDWFHQRHLQNDKPVLPTALAPVTTLKVQERRWRLRHTWIWSPSLTMVDRMCSCHCWTNCYSTSRRHHHRQHQYSTAQGDRRRQGRQTLLDVRGFP